VGLSVGDFIAEFSNKKTTMDIVQGQALEKRSFEIIKKCDKPRLFEFARSKSIGIPVRLHDFDSFRDCINVGTYEFHLSYQECNNGNFSQALKCIDERDNISIHLPDYIPGNHILDPVSSIIEVKRESRALIANVTGFAEKIRQKISKDVPIIGSFSQTNGKAKKIILDELFSFLDNGKLSAFQILPQWLPVYAWYFGGAVKLDLFNSLEDIEFIIQNKRPICLDVCHLGLSANYAGVDWRDWYQKLLPYNKHSHLADSLGVDGEGLPLGAGDIGDFELFLPENGLKIIEVWQGHFNQGEGFLTALKTLAGK
jgi:N-acetylneuraminate synthase